SDVDTRDFFVLQNVANNMRARHVRADGEFPHAVAVLVRAGVGAKFVTQILVLRLQRTDAIIFHFDGKRVGFEIAEAFTEIIAHYAIDDEHAVSVHRRSENFASRQVAPFVARDDPARFEPSQFRRKLSFKLSAMRRLADDAFSFAGAFDQALTQVIHFHKVGPHAFEHDLSVDVHHMTVSDSMLVDDTGHLRPGRELAWLRLGCEDRYLRARQIVQDDLWHEFQRTPGMMLQDK